jgi:hypothetical protein
VKDITEPISIKPIHIQDLGKRSESKTKIVCRVTH